jgi:hypothetical protein
MSYSHPIGGGDGTIAHAGESAGRPHRRRPPRRRGRHGPMLLSLAVLAAVVLVAFVFIGYVLWPRWPRPVRPNAPALPITVAGVTFNLPPAAIRVPVQRRPGAHERVDLAFMWPSLEPPDPSAKPAPAPPRTLDRIFLTIASAGETMPPAERLLTIYPHYAAAEVESGPGGLTLLAFRPGTPYWGEDLIYDAAAPGFLVRCTRNGAGSTPGTCLYERRIEAADLVLRFPRDWLGDWRGRRRHRAVDWQAAAQNVGRISVA